MKKKKTVTENRIWNKTRFIDSGKEGVRSRTPLDKNYSSRIADERITVPELLTKNITVLELPMKKFLIQIPEKKKCFPNPDTS